MRFSQNRVKIRTNSDCAFCLNKLINAYLKTGTKLIDHPDLVLFVNL